MVDTAQPGANRTPAEIWSFWRWRLTRPIFGKDNYEVKVSVFTQEAVRSATKFLVSKLEVSWEKKSANR